jgi:chromosome segregation ATPase
VRLNSLQKEIKRVCNQAMQHRNETARICDKYLRLEEEANAAKTKANECEHNAEQLEREAQQSSEINQESTQPGDAAQK